jgi:TPR repeat protein
MPAPEVEAMIVAANRNNGQAQYDLGLAYLNGDGVQQDFGEAYFWLTVCCETQNTFWSPSPEELAAEASLQIFEEAVLAKAINRALRWLAEHAPPIAEDY